MNTIPLLTPDLLDFPISPSRTPLVSDCIYHLYNRGNNSEPIFQEEQNYHYFMELFWFYMLPVADVFAFCLLGNHFHFCLRVKSWPNMTFYARLAAFLGTYARVFNKHYGRTGSLFEGRCKRKIVLDDSYLTNLIVYIHKNPQHHSLVDDFRSWDYSSFHPLIGVEQTALRRAETLAGFGGLHPFLSAHDPWAQPRVEAWGDFGI